MSTQDDPTSAQSSKTNLYAMLLITASIFLFQSNSTMVKWSTLPIIEMLWFRMFVAFIVAYLLWKYKKRDSHLNEPWYAVPEHRRIAWILGMSCNFSSGFLWIGLYLVPVGDAACFFLLGPIFISLIGHLYLHDPLAKTYIITLIGSIISIVILSQPAVIFHRYHIDEHAEPINPLGIVALLIGSTSYVAAAILTRKANQVHALQVLLIETFQGVFVWCPLLFLVDIYALQTEQHLVVNVWVLLFGVALGISHCLAELCITIGYQIGDSTKVTWFEYTDTIFAFLYQSFLFHDVPNKWEIIGCVGINVCSSLPLIEELFKYGSSVRQPETSTQETSTATEDETDDENENKRLLKQNSAVHLEPVDEEDKKKHVQMGQV